MYRCHRIHSLFAAVGLLVLLGWFLESAEPAADQATTMTLQKSKDGAKLMTQKATFGAGCFWGVEAAFRNVKGVANTTVGYSGGKMEHPTYRDVCTDETGHAEVVEVEFDPSVVTYKQLLDVFWKIHNPTTMNRQGPDVGTQYRSVIFYHTPEQKAEAEASKAALGKSGKYKNPVVTKIEAAGPFWRAEEYHQRYLEKHGLESCHIPG